MPALVPLLTIDPASSGPNITSPAFVFTGQFVPDRGTAKSKRLYAVLYKADLTSMDIRSVAVDLKAHTWNVRFHKLTAATTYLFTVYTGTPHQPLKHVTVRVSTP